MMRYLIAAALAMAALTRAAPSAAALYGPGNTSRSVTCVTQYVAGSGTRTCR